MISYKQIYFSLFLFLVGPPAFRDVNDVFYASEGQTDIWIFIKVISYLIIFYILFKQNSFLKVTTIRNNKFLNLNFFVIFIFFYLSSLFGPRPQYSISYTTLFLFGFIFYNLYLNLFLNLKDFKLINLIKIINNILIFLIIFTILLSIFFPNYVSVIKNESFYRIIGNKISDFKVIPIFTLTISFISFLFSSKNILNINFFYSIISILALYLSQTRSIIFISFLIVLVFTLVFFITNKKNKNNLNKKILFYFLILFFLTFLSLDFILTALTRGNTVSLFELSGREFVWSTIINYMESRFLGFGLGYAVKDLFLNLPNYYNFVSDSLLITKNIGSAHNFYLEFLISGGWICFICIICIHIYLLKISINLLIYNADLESKIIATLYFVFTFIALFDSFAFVPTSNSFAFYWILITMILIKRNKILNENK